MIFKRSIFYLAIIFIVSLHLTYSATDSEGSDDEKNLRNKETEGSDDENNGRNKEPEWSDAENNERNEEPEGSDAENNERNKEPEGSDDEKNVRNKEPEGSDDENNEMDNNSEGSDDETRKLIKDEKSKGKSKFKINPKEILRAGSKKLTKMPKKLTKMPSVLHREFKKTSDRYNFPYSRGCMYAGGEMYKIHECLFELKKVMLISAEFARASSKNVEIILKRGGASDDAVKKMKKYGDASIFRYGEERGEPLYAGIAHFDKGKCKENKDTSKLKQYEVIVTSHTKEPICLECAYGAIKHYEKKNEVLPPEKQTCGPSKKDKK